MTAAYVRAIRGPVLLMVLGALMLADHRAGLSFWNSWPLLLVTGGLLVLAERTAIRENPWTAPAAAAGPPPPPSTAVYRRFGEEEAPKTTNSEGGPQA